LDNTGRLRFANHSPQAFPPFNTLNSLNPIHRLAK
jgi:hypothetical protein